jgi:hypothetical protein
MNKQTMITVAITAVIVLIAANKLRSLPVLSKLPTV